MADIPSASKWQREEHVTHGHRRAVDGFGDFLRFEERFPDINDRSLALVGLAAVEIIGFERRAPIWLYGGTDWQAAQALVTQIPTASALAFVTRPLTMNSRLGKHLNGLDRQGQLLVKAAFGASHPIEELSSGEKQVLLNLSV